MDYSPIVLKNKGVPCEFVKVKKIDETLYERVLNEDGEIVKDTLMVRFTNNTIADIEQHWGTLEAWQEALTARPVSTCRDTLSFALRRPILEIGEAMIDGEIMTYSNVIGIAWAIANGVDPIVASRMLKQSAVLAEAQKETLNKALEQNNQLIQDSLGDSGSKPGPKRAARSKNSGN
jgi:hypothetical protein